MPEGAQVGQPVKLRKWQRKIILSIYDGATRRAIISFGRKNGKTALAAFLLLLHLVGPEARQNSQLFSAAQSRDQAAVLFALAAKMVRMSPDLNEAVIVRDGVKQLACPDLGTLYRALSAEASTAYGLSPVFVVHDELGQVRGPRSELYEALETAAGAQAEPLSVIISTQAPTDADLLSILIDDAASGKDPKTKLFLYAAPDDADPFSKSAQKAANPALGDFLNEIEVADQAAAAERMPSRESAYRNLILNQRVDQTSPFVSRNVWASGDGPCREAVFLAGDVFIGLDLSARNDLTALCLAAIDVPTRDWHFRPEFFAPLVGVHDRAKRDRAPYDLWHQQGLLNCLPGSSVDYSALALRLCELCDDYRVKAIAFDRWRIDVLQAELKRLGRELPLVPWGQGFKDMSPALDALEAELLNGHVRHGGHPILRWCASNAIATRDPAGNRKLDKGKASGRIDGLQAMAMAIGVATRHQIPEPCIYDTRELLVL